MKPNSDGDDDLITLRFISGREVDDVISDTAQVGTLGDDRIKRG